MVGLGAEVALGCFAFVAESLGVVAGAGTFSVLLIIVTASYAVSVTVSLLLLVREDLSLRSSMDMTIRKPSSPSSSSPSCWNLCVGM